MKCKKILISFTKSCLKGGVSDQTKNHIKYFYI